eukprot:2455103-Amphidinium_carterae.1
MNLEHHSDSGTINVKTQRVSIGLVANHSSVNVVQGTRVVENLEMLLLRQDEQSVLTYNTWLGVALSAVTNQDQKVIQSVIYMRKSHRPSSSSIGISKNMQLRNPDFIKMIKINLT